jgi:hypothetical protein
MATAVFSPCAGAVGIVKVNSSGGCSPTDALFKIDFAGANGQLTVPVSGFALELNGNYQFLHTVNDFIYVYAFGDRIGELVVSGFGFVKPCAGANSAAVDSVKLCNVYDFYQRNRIMMNGNMSVSLGDCGNATFWAFLTGMRLELQDPNTLIGQWSFRFNVIPPK